MFAIVGDVRGADATAVFEHNRVGGRGRHDEQEQSYNQRCAMHISILAMGHAHLPAAFAGLCLKWHAGLKWYAWVLSGMP